jgi:protein SCO1/2
LLWLLVVKTLAPEPASRNQIILTAVVLLFAAGLSVSLFVYKQVNRQLSPEEFRQMGAYIFNPPRAFESFTLLDQHGNTFDQQRLQGQWSLVFFGYTFCPDVCPTTLAVLRDVEERLRAEGEVALPQIILVTVDPARDTPDVLRTYLEYFSKDFVGVTGEFMSLQAFARQLNTTFRKQPGGGDNYLVDHSSSIVIINPRGHYQGFFKLPFEAAKLTAAFRAVQKQY